MISTIYHSPLGDLVLKADARGLVSLRFADADGVGAAADGATSDSAEMGAAPASGGDGSNAGCYSWFECRFWALGGRGRFDGGRGAVGLRV